VYRRLLEESAILDVVDRCRERFISSLRPVPNAQIVAALAVTARQPVYTVRDPGDLWTLAISSLPDFEQRRGKIREKKVRHKILDHVLDAVAAEAAVAWTSEERAMPKQLSTNTPVMACSTTPARTRASSSDGSEEKWKRFYSSVVQRGHGSEISMQNYPARYFLMAERDKRGQVNETEQKGVSPTSGGQPEAEQGRTGGIGQGGASGTSKGKCSSKWRQFTNTLTLWCKRHQAALAATHALKRTDRLQHRAERAINYANNPFFGPHARGHIHAYLGLPNPGKRFREAWSGSCGCARGHASATRNLWASNGRNGDQVEGKAANLI
jgi:hypothetical protein